MKVGESYFELPGLDEWERDLWQIVEKQYPDEFNAMLMDVLERLETGVKERTPVDTGLLQGNWMPVAPRKEGDWHLVGVRNETEYVQPVEFGHRIKNRATGKVVGFVQGKHMLQNTLAEIEEQLPGYLENWLNDFMERHGI